VDGKNRVFDYYSFTNSTSIRGFTKVSEGMIKKGKMLSIDGEENPLFTWWPSEFSTQR